jgi:hypothetical protein
VQIFNPSKTRLATVLSLLALSILLPIGEGQSARAQRAQEQEQQQQQQPSTFLKGSADEYSVISKPLDPLLWPGNNFDKDAARSLLYDQSKESSIWKRIPEWQAGNWEINQAVNTKAVKYVNGVPVEVTPLGVHKAAAIFTKGMERDRKGDIWHWFQSDYWTETDQGSDKAVSYILFSSPGQASDCDFYAEAVEFKVNKATNIIGSVRRSRQWTRYINLGKDSMKEESIRSNFDQQGSPTATTWNSALDKRSAPFTAYEKDFAANKEMQTSFQSYLRKHGLESLIPGSTAAPKADAAKKPAAKVSH